MKSNQFTRSLIRIFNKPLYFSINSTLHSRIDVGGIWSSVELLGLIQDVVHLEYCSTKQCNNEMFLYLVEMCVPSLFFEVARVIQQVYGKQVPRVFQFDAMPRETVMNVVWG